MHFFARPSSLRSLRSSVPPHSPCASELETDNVNNGAVAARSKELHVIAFTGFMSRLTSLRGRRWGSGQVGARPSARGAATRTIDAPREVGRSRRRRRLSRLVVASGPIYKIRSFISPQNAIAKKTE